MNEKKKSYKGKHSADAGSKSHKYHLKAKGAKDTSVYWDEVILNIQPDKTGYNLCYGLINLWNNKADAGSKPHKDLLQVIKENKPLQAGCIYWDKLMFEDQMELAFLNIVGYWESKKLSIGFFKRFRKLMSESAYSGEAIKYCIRKYIESELDCTTLGNRGIGRMTANIPRFGAYFRKPLSKLSNQELNELYFLIQALCIKGYVGSDIYMMWPAMSDKLSDKVLLFNEWIPKIYITNPYNIGPNFIPFGYTNIIRMYSEIDDPIVGIKIFMRKHGMEKSKTRKILSGDFKSPSWDILSRDKINEILEYYIVAGYVLRAVEVRAY